VVFIQNKDNKRRNARQGTCSKGRVLPQGAGDGIHLLKAARKSFAVGEEQRLTGLEGVKKHGDRESTESFKGFAP
jgi:hypothetical protein